MVLAVGVEWPIMIKCLKISACLIEWLFAQMHVHGASFQKVCDGLYTSCFSQILLQWWNEVDDMDLITAAIVLFYITMAFENHWTIIA